MSHIYTLCSAPYLQCYRLISISLTTLSSTSHISHFSPPLLQIPHLLHPMADFLFWQQSCCALLASHRHKHAHTHHMTMTPRKPCAYPQCALGMQGHQRGWRVCVSLFAVCYYACCHPAAVCMFYPAVHLHTDEAASGALVTSYH